MIAALPDIEPDENLTDDYMFVQEGGAVTRSQTKAVSPTKAKPASPPKTAAVPTQTSPARWSPG